MPYKNREDHKRALKRYYKKNTQKFANSKRKRKDKIRKFLVEFKLANPCKCGEKNPACLQFHHLDPTEKEIALSQVITKCWGIEKIKKEIEKCEVMCANCHLKLHYSGKFY